jgi:hypothetical protein
LNLAADGRILNRAGRHGDKPLASGDFRMRATILALFAAALAGPALAQVSAPPIAQIDTELTKGRCRFIADDGEVGHYALKRCPGLGGSIVYTEAGVNFVSLSFHWGKVKASKVVRSWSLGDKLEWRGTRDKRGFTPYAVIVRVIVRDHEKDESHNVWGVLRIERRNACLNAAIEEDANSDALAIARKIADETGSRTNCKDIKPKIVGVSTRWGAEVTGAREGDRKPD